MPNIADKIINSKAGSDQSQLRDQNQRAVLSFLRHNGSAPSAEIARRLGLSAQTVSNIIRALVAGGLLKLGKTQKGKVGKPSVPVMLNPDGVHGFGLNIGRRSTELVLVDFVGTQLETISIAYAYPTVEAVLTFLEDGISQILNRHHEVKKTLSGIGVAHPSQIWEWLEVVNAPKEAMLKWRTFDLQVEIVQRTGLGVFIENDATSACVAEQLLGRGDEFSDFAYIFLGAFIGGGLVLSGKVVPGRTKNMASLGPMPVPDGKGDTTELLNVTSLHLLEALLRRDSIDPMELRATPEDWAFCEAQLAEWIDTTSYPLALAAAAITSVVEVEAILIDGAMPQSVCARLTRATKQKFEELDLTLIKRPLIEQASVGKTARSLGAALLPIHSRYFLA